MNLLCQDPSSGAAPALSGGAPGKPLTVTHGPLDHKRSDATGHFVPVMDTGALAGWAGGGWGEICAALQSPVSLLRRAPMGMPELSGT